MRLMHSIILVSLICSTISGLAKAILFILFLLHLKRYGVKYGIHGLFFDDMRYELDLCITSALPFQA